MLNPREEVEYWHLLDVVVWFTVAAVVCVAIGLFAAAMSFIWEEAREPLVVIAIADELAAALLGLLLRRAWRRLNKLEEFVP